MRTICNDVHDVIIIIIYFFIALLTFKDTVILVFCSLKIEEIV